MNFRWPSTIIEMWVQAGKGISISYKLQGVSFPYQGDAYYPADIELEAVVRESAPDGDVVIRKVQGDIRFEGWQVIVPFTDEDTNRLDISKEYYVELWAKHKVSQEQVLVWASKTSPVIRLRLLPLPQVED